MWLIVWLESWKPAIDWFIKQSQPPSACQCDLFIQEGARLGRTPAEVVSMCDITFSCVSDPKAARDVSTPTGLQPFVGANYTRQRWSKMSLVKWKHFPLRSWCWDPAACYRASGPANATWRCQPSTQKPSQSSHRFGGRQHSRNVQDFAKSPPQNAHQVSRRQEIRSRGGRFLEAPVAGSQQISNDGMLVILAAGDRTVYEDCSSCFQAMGKTSFFLGT